MLSPRMAYVLLWFPLSSETFVFREIQQLVQRGMDIRVYTMYGEKLRGCSDEMKNYAGPIKRFGSMATLRLLKAFWRAWKRDRETVKTLMRRGLFRKMRNLEAYAENLWCFLAGFLLAEEAQRDGIELLHSSWGNGPATAVWVASRLSGIPFAFTGRAGDIYPQDGILAEKSRDAIFIRTNNMANKPWLQSFCPAGQKDKVHVIYNGLTLGRRVDCRAPFQKPYRLLAIGRFARTKGFPELLTAMARLRDDGFPVRLTLVGDGNWKRKLVDMRKRLHLEDLVDMPGFVPNDRIRTFMEEHDMCTPTATATASPTSSWRPFPAACPWWPPMSAAWARSSATARPATSSPSAIPPPWPMPSAACSPTARRPCAWPGPGASSSSACSIPRPISRPCRISTASSTRSGAPPTAPTFREGSPGKGPSASTEVCPSPALFSGALSESCPAVVSRGAPSGSAPCRERKQSPFPRSATVFRRSPFPDTCNRRPAA